jgi:hypothetical protein
MRDFLLACLAAVVLVGGLALGAVLGLVAGAIVIGLAVVFGLGLLAWSLVRAARPRPH